MTHWLSSDGQLRVVPVRKTLDDGISRQYLRIQARTIEVALRHGAAKITSTGRVNPRRGPDGWYDVADVTSVAEVAQHVPLAELDERE